MSVCACDHDLWVCVCVDMTVHGSVGVCKCVLYSVWLCRGVGKNVCGCVHVIMICGCVYVWI